jgi:hypothetical protein
LCGTLAPVSLSVHVAVDGAAVKIALRYREQQYQPRMTVQDQAGHDRGQAQQVHSYRDQTGAGAALKQAGALISHGSGAKSLPLALDRVAIGRSSRALVGATKESFDKKGRGRQRGP